MVLKDRLKDLVVRFKEILDSKEGLLDCFCRYGVQLEGWLKGEFLYFLDNEKSTGRIVHFDREVSIGMGKKKVDFEVKISTDSGVIEAWIELKHWLIGYQKGTLYNAQFYCGDPSSVGIKPDAEKLSDISNGHKFLLILTTANPGMNDWLSGVNKFNRKFSPLYLKSLTNPADFPSFYYVGLLEVTNISSRDVGSFMGSKWEEMQKEMRTPAWSESEFEILLNSYSLSDEELTRELPKRSLGAIGVVRAGIHSFHRGGNVSMLSRMMLRCLEEKRGSLSCSVCGAKF